MKSSSTDESRHVCGQKVPSKEGAKRRVTAGPRTRYSLEERRELGGGLSVREARARQRSTWGCSGGASESRLSAQRHPNGACTHSHPTGKSVLPAGLDCRRQGGTRSCTFRCTCALSLYLSRKGVGDLSSTSTRRINYYHHHH